MANKIKRIIPNNLLQIRTSLGYTQEKMGEILEVGVRTICNYEIGATNLPPDKAMTLYEEYGYSFDYIYANVKESNSERDAFLIDIRDLIVLRDDKIYFKIPDSYWNYLYKLSEINNSIDTNQSKKNKKLELDAKYIDDSNNHSYSVLFSKEEFLHGFLSGNEFVPCCDEKNNIKQIHIATDEEKRKITEILEG